MDGIEDDRVISFTGKDIEPYSGQRRVLVASDDPLSDGPCQYRLIGFSKIARGGPRKGNRLVQRFLFEFASPAPDSNLMFDKSFVLGGVQDKPVQYRTSVSHRMHASYGS